MITIDFAPISEFFDRHEKVVLQFSAGKDSAACLLLLRPWWDKLMVVWCNQGNPYPETLAYMENVAEFVPNFTVIYGGQPAWIKQNGYPVDVLPLESTQVGKIIASEKGPTLQPFWSCCHANSWQPMEDFLAAYGATGVVRGQKLVDGLKTQEASGAVANGIEYLFPIESWSDDQVYDYVGSRIPASYKRGIKTSLDCMNCTAYMKENAGRLVDLVKIDASAYEEVTSVHKYLKEKLTSHLTALEACNG